MIWNSPGLGGRGVIPWKRYADTAPGGGEMGDWDGGNLVARGGEKGGARHNYRADAAA